MGNSSRGMGDDVVSFDDVIDRVIPAVAGRDDLVDVRTMTVYKPDGVVTDHVSVLVRDTTKRCAIWQAERARGQREWAVSRASHHRDARPSSYTEPGDPRPDFDAWLRDCDAYNAQCWGERS